MRREHFGLNTYFLCHCIATKERHALSLQPPAPPLLAFYISRSWRAEQNPRIEKKTRLNTTPKSVAFVTFSVEREPSSPETFIKKWSERKIKLCQAPLLFPYPTT